MIRFVARTLLASTALLIGACASTEVARLDDVDTLKKDEAQIWEESRQATVGIINALGDDNPALQEYVSGVLRRLVENSTSLTPDFQPSVTVLKTPSANAAAMPHGDLFITHGMLAQLDNEAQLAFVLGHEIVHYRRRHALISQRYARNQRTKSTLVSVALTALTGVPIINENESAWQLALNSGYSRELEIESDLASLEMISVAGYDAREAVGALQKLRSERPEVGDPLFASHPDVETRVALVTEQLSTGNGAGVELGETRYQAEIHELVVPQGLALIENGEVRTARSLLNRHLDRNPNDARTLFAIGESVRASSSSREASKAAAEFYRRAVATGEAPAEAYRELGLHHRFLAETEQASQYFALYLEKAPEAVDAPLIKTYLLQEPQ